MFSAESIYDALFLTLYNVMYTSLPVLFLSLTEKVYPETKLLRYLLDLLFGKYFTRIYSTRDIRGASFR